MTLGWLKNLQHQDVIISSGVEEAIRQMCSGCHDLLGTQTRKSGTWVTAQRKPKKKYRELSGSLGHGKGKVDLLLHQLGFF